MALMTPADYATFEALVQDVTTKNELECRPYLEYADNLLIQKTLRSTVRFHEVRSFSGDADIILVATVLTDTGNEEAMAFCGS